jgi:large conductance mechanosensitive channel
MLKEFKAFVLRGNVVDLAVGVVIGAAFGAIVNSLVKDVVSPVLSLLHLPDFSRSVVELGPEGPEGDIAYGLVINAVISFIAIAAVVFFFVVKPVNSLMTGGKPKEEPKVKECPHCLSSIPAQATVCAHCTREVQKRTGRPRSGAR